MSGFSVRTFIADGVLADGAAVPLPERLGVLIAVVVTALSRGITSDVGSTRIQMLGGGLRRGLIPFRRHCNEVRSKMHIPAH